jgi:inorganic triphosphatase YgiF
MSDAVERELKLMPASENLLNALAGVERLGPFAVAGRRHQLQHNVFFDSESQAFRKLRVGFRRRKLEGERQATWTIKGEGQHLRGVATRSEIELRLDVDLAPALAIGTLRDAARSRGATLLADDVDAALAEGGLPRAEPFLETETDRTIVDLEAQDRGWSVELALDRVRLIGHRCTELEIEAELKAGDEEALDAARSAIESYGEVRESEGSKLSRAIDHLARCDCR